MQSTYEEEESGQEDDSGIASEEMLSMDEEDSQDASDSFIEAEPSSSKPACGYRVLDDAGVSALQVCGIPCCLRRQPRRARVPETAGARLVQAPFQH
jgi:hypothetical protein